MKEKGSKRDLHGRQAGNKKENNLQGYPIYPEDEDIYVQYQECKEINPEDPSNFKESIENSKVGISNKKGFDDYVPGSDLDIPGSELDDKQENVGSEDEENNYFSLGGDDHNDLEEDKGE
jgi:hypothetical protein